MDDFFADFRQAYENRHAIAASLQAGGKRVMGCCYSGVPEEIVYAADMLPVQMVESDDTDTVLRGEAIMPEYVCDYCQSLLGQTVAGDYAYLDGILISDACANIRTLLRAWEVRRQPDYYYFFTPPFSQNEEGHTYYAREMVRFRQSLEAHGGKAISDAAVRGAIHLCNENRKAFKALVDLRAQKPGIVPGSRMLDILKAGFVMHRSEHTRLVEGLLRRLADAKPAVSGRVPLFVSIFNYEHCAFHRFHILEMIEEMGGLVAGDDLWHGLRYSCELVEEDGDVMAALARRYAGKIPMGYRYPLQPRLDWLLAEIARSGARGAVFVVPKYCHPYLFEYPYIDREMRRRKIPALFIESEAGMPAAPVRTRVQAFLEMLS